MTELQIPTFINCFSVSTVQMLNLICQVVELH